MSNKKEKYVVVSPFKDLQDKNKVYQAEDVYPRPANKKIKDDRIKELLTKKSRTGKPFIKKAEDEQG